jgi:flagellar hook-associated protein 1
VSLIVGLYTGLSSIRASTVGIDTAAHNIANAATPGYTRQRVELAAATPFLSPDGPIGTGVDVLAIARLRDHFADMRVRTTLAEFAQLDVRADLLGRAEVVMGEPEGIGLELQRLWNAFEDLAMDPADTATRTQVLAQLEAVTARIRSVATGWDQLAVDTTSRRDQAVAEANRLLHEVADINRQVANQDPLTVSNDLLDRRDLALDRLAELTGANSARQADGTVTVTLGGATLVQGDTVESLGVSGADVIAGATTLTGAVTGELGGLQASLVTDLPTLRGQLDDVVAVLAATLNTQHAAGFAPDGSPGGPLLTFGADPSTSVTVALTDPGMLATAADVDPGSGLPGALDGRNAQLLADLRSATGPGSATEELRTMIVDLGASVAALRRSADAAGDVAVGAAIGRQSQHGVSLDEEMVDLVRYQRQLEAASRVMTAIDEALETLVNRVGIVGR